MTTDPFSPTKKLNMTPTHVNDLVKYWDNLSQDHKNLQFLSMLGDDA